MKRLLSVIVISIALTGLISCEDDDKDVVDPTVVFKATLDGAQEAPNPVTTTETGNATLTFNTITKVFTITVTHTIASPTNGHIHKGAAGTSGGVIFPFATFTSPINYTGPAWINDDKPRAAPADNVFLKNFLRGELIFKFS